MKLINRIFLSEHRTKANCFWVKDVLDKKSIGTITIKKNDYQYDLKQKYKAKFIETESLLLLDNDINMNLTDVYKIYLTRYLNDIIKLENYNFPMFLESCRLKACEPDLFNRPTLLHPAAKTAWEQMKLSANKYNINLQIISAYRSLDYQKNLIINKLDKGLSIDSILNVNTLPGYSEHHTGCAIDIGSTDAAVLEYEFDQSNAYKWLTKNAHHFGFVMTYPKGNTSGICYEPWHWCFKI